MPVNVDFEAKYRSETDPWSIGNADSPRYDAYRRLLLRHAIARSSILDVGAGLGAFLARLAPEFETAVGVDVSPDAVRRGQARFPDISFNVGSAGHLEALAAIQRPWDAIVFSDVIYYLPDSQKVEVLKWIAAHLGQDGRALVAAWCPGGRYLTVGELRDLVSRHLTILEEVVFESGHVAFVTRSRHFLVALTLDYETWQPVPEGRQIDWDADVFEPTDRWLSTADAFGAKLTFFAEMGEHAWLLENEPTIAARMEGQWQAAIRKGHDVQLHVHPAWLPEHHPRRDGRNWSFDGSTSNLANYTGDLTSLLRTLRDRLEGITQGADPAHRVRIFRAGAYQVQPTTRLHDALLGAGLVADSSVWRGGLSAERGYDFRLAYSDRVPYHASRSDMSLLALPSERGLIEAPIWSSPDRWSLDGNLESFAKRLTTFMARNIDAVPRTIRSRTRARIQRAGRRLLFGRLAMFWPAVARIAPRRLVHQLAVDRRPRRMRDEYFVGIGHTKGDHDFGPIRNALRQLVADPRIRLTTMTDLIERAADEPDVVGRSHSDDSTFQVAREVEAVMADGRNRAPSLALQALIPLDSETILDLGCAGGYWTDEIARSRPWATLVGVDAGEQFIERARREFASDRVRFEVGDFGALPLENESFDAVYADNVLEHVFDLGAALGEVLRVLKPGGFLIAAIPVDGRNPSADVDNHTWKATVADVKRRLEGAGFEQLEMQERDLLRELAQPPYPPSLDRILYIRARRPSQFEADQELAGITAWVHDHLDPQRSHEGKTPAQILRGGTAWCFGYAYVLESVARQHGFDAQQISMTAREHAKGRGSLREDTHEVVEVQTTRGFRTLDAMTDRVIPYGISELLSDPSLASSRSGVDQTYHERRYDLYDTGYWYSRVTEYRIGRKTHRNSRTAH